MFCGVGNPLDYEFPVLNVVIHPLVLLKSAALSLFLAGFGKISRQGGAASVALSTKCITQHKQLLLPSQLPPWPCSPGLEGSFQPLVNLIL